MASEKSLYPTESFKRQAAERVLTSGLPIRRVAEELGVHETVLRRWMTRFAEPGTGTARRPVPQAQGPSPADLAAENARLRRALQRARTERDMPQKRTARPVCKLISSMEPFPVCANVSGIGANAPRPDGASRVPVLTKTTAS